MSDPAPTNCRPDQHPSTAETQASVSNAFSFAHALLFTGHMIDTPGRKRPRFPAYAESNAREAIRKSVSEISWTASGPTLGLAAAASGADLLFHEVCAELGIATRIMLALPVDEFLASSVAPAGPDWVSRFHALLAARGPQNVCFMSSTDGMSDGATNNIWQRANLWMIDVAVAAALERVLLALWDGTRGDGPGGTDYFVQTAPRVGIRIAPPIQMQSLL